MKRVVHFLFGLETPGVWLRMSLLVTAVGIGAIGSVSFLSESLIRSDFSIDLDILNSPDASHPGIPVVVVQQANDGIFVHIRMKGDLRKPPAIVMSGVTEKNCYVSSNPVSGISPSFDPRLKLRSGIGEDKQPLSIIEFEHQSDDNIDSPLEIFVSCRTSISPHKDTYADRRIVVIAMGTPAGKIMFPGRQIMGPKEYIVDFSDFVSRDSFRVWGGKRTDADVGTDATAIRQVSASEWAGPYLTAAWRDTQSLLFRDVVLVASGAIFGLAGAFFVEWFRSCLG